MITQLVMGYLQLLKKIGIKSEKHALTLLKIESYLNEIVDKVSDCISCTEARKKIQEIRDTISLVRNGKYESPEIVSKSNDASDNSNMEAPATKTIIEKVNRPVAPKPSQKKDDEEPYIVKQRPSEDIEQKKKEKQFYDFVEYFASMPKEVKDRNFREIQGIMEKIIDEEPNYSERLINNFKSEHQFDSNKQNYQSNVDQYRNLRFKRSKIRKLSEVASEFKTRLRIVEDFMENLTDDSSTNKLKLSLRDLEGTIKSVEGILDSRDTISDSAPSPPPIESEKSIVHLVDDIETTKDESISEKKEESSSSSSDDDNTQAIKAFLDEDFEKVQDSLISLNKKETSDNIDGILENINPYFGSRKDAQTSEITKIKKSLVDSLSGNCRSSNIIAATTKLFSSVSTLLKEKTKLKTSEGIEQAAWKLFDESYKSWISNSKGLMASKIDSSCKKLSTSFRLKQVQRDIDEALAMN